MVRNAVGLSGAASGQQLDDEHDRSDHEYQVDETATDLEAESEKPEHKQNS